MDRFVSGLVCLMVAGGGVSAQVPNLETRNAIAIRPSAGNAFFWEYRGEPVILIGGSVEDNLFQTPEVAAHLDLLVASGGNYVRNTLSSRDDSNLWPFAQNEDGRYDLDRANDAYYERLSTFLQAAYERDVIVQFEMWDRFDYAQQFWEKNPFRPVNNITYTVADSGLKNNYPQHPGSNENPFFRSVPKQENNPLILKYQQAHVDRVLAISLAYPNVLYCMDNETNAHPEWGAYWSTYIKAAADEKGVLVQTTEMWDNWNLRAPEHRGTLDHPEQYSFIDTSQNNHKKGQEHWDNLQWVREYIRDAPRPINHVKVYGADGERFGNNRDGLERFWRTLLGGAASVRFHRPAAGLGLSSIAQSHIRSGRMLANAFDLAKAVPGVDAALVGVEPNEAYMTTIPGVARAVYFPTMGSATLTIEPGVRLRWLDISASSWGAEILLEGASVELSPPSDTHWLALIKE